MPAWSSITAELKYTGYCTASPSGDWNPNQTRQRSEIQFDSNEKEIIDSEIIHLLEMGDMEPAIHSPDEYISTISCAEKEKWQISHDFEFERAQSTH